TAREGRVLAPLEGRSSELATLQELWRDALDNRGRAALVVAEAGMGKSRLLAALEEQTGSMQREVVHLSCQPHYRNTTLYPLLAFLSRRAGISRDDKPVASLGKISALLDQHKLGDETNRALFAAMLKIPADDLYTPPVESPQRQRQAFYPAAAALLLSLGQGSPLLLFMEDLHWADPTTLEFMGSLLDSFSQQPVLLVETTRPEIAITEDPRLRVITLEGLSADATGAIVRHVSRGRPLPPSLVDLIRRRSDGNPLFVEELTKTLLESGQLREDDGQMVLTESAPQAAIPTTLHDSLMARLDHLNSVKELAQIGATIGREFSLELLTALSSKPAASILADLAKLEEAEIVFAQPRDGKPAWYFKHALIQEAAYESLLRSRRRELHALIAETLETQYTDETGLQPELMAFHLSRAGKYRRAVHYGQSAGMAALTRSANAEAIEHARACLAWLQHLPEGEDRSRIELGVNTMLTPALMAQKGYASGEVEASANRALELLDTLGDRPEAFPSLWGLKLFHHVRSERKRARELAERFLALAERSGDTDQFVAGLPMTAQCCWIEGDHKQAEELLRRGISLYVEESHRHHAFQYGFDSLSYSRMTLSQVLWITGRSDEAVVEAEESVAHARRINHANTIGIALLYVMLIRQQRGETDLVAELGAETLSFCERMGVTTPSSYAAIIANWVKGDVEGSQGIFAVHDAIGAHLGMTYYRSLAAENAIIAGRLDDARTILEPALKQAATTGERYWEPQLMRLQARIALAEGQPETIAADLLREAAGKAGEMGGTMLEALALIDLSRLSTVEDTAESRTRLAELVSDLGGQLPAEALSQIEKLNIFDR
ncbi:MAG: AAA family ATPase, partial [Pseudomonadota bacterium]